MNNQSRSLLASAGPRIQAALQDYLDRIDKGELIDVDAFVVQHKEIAEELRSFIAVDQEARKLAGAVGANIVAPVHAPAGKSPPTKAEVSTHSVLGSIEGTVGGQLNTPNASASVVSAASASGDLPDQFGRYVVQKKLGSGAMGAVYLAEDTLLHRRVALKTPTFDDDKDGELLRRFYREARAVAILKHPNLCAVYDVGEIAGRHYISMEFVRGKKLQDYIRPDKQMSESQSMAVVRKIALAMHEAHSHGVIHRDLKPDNIMVNEKGEPVVMDFGLVHRKESQDSTRITQRGMLIGSPAYMSKEQVEGDPDKLTSATDQYSLGVILYQLLTSKLPFEGGIHGVLAAILTKDPAPPSQLRSDLNPHLEAVCLKMMAKEAKDRYPSMKAVADAILAVSKGTSKAAGSVVVAEPAARSLTEGLTATFAGASIAADQPLPMVKVGDSFLKSRISRAKQKDSKGLLYACLAGGLFLLFSVIFWIRSGKAVVKIEVLADDVQVAFDNATLCIVESGKEHRVTPGDHTLHIKSKDAEFDTGKFTLKRGENPVVTVEVVDAEIVVKLGNDIVSRPSSEAQAEPQMVVESNSSSKSAQPKGEPNNLLTAIDLKRDTISGPWIEAGGVLVSPNERNASVTLPVEFIPEEYQMTIKAERVSGTNNLSLFLVYGGKEAHIVLDSDAKGVICSGLNMLNGKFVNENVTTWRKRVFPTGKSVTVVCTVRKDGIQVDADGQTVFDWHGTPDSLSHDPNWTDKLPMGKFAIGSWEAVFKISGISLQPFAPADSLVFQNKRFKLFTEQLSWHEAQRKCRTMGGRLAEVRSFAENDFLLKLAKDAGQSGIWLGATDEAQEGKWLWSDNSGLAFNYFANGFPNRMKAGQQYLVMMIKINSGQWCNQPDRSTDWTPGFVCEWDADERPQSMTVAASGTVESDGWTELFNGRNLAGWVSASNGTPGTWKVEGGYMEATPRVSIMTAKMFSLDFQLHAEFWIPKEDGNAGQGRGNSGIFLLGRHEIQILDMFENPGNPAPIVGLGALFNSIAPTGLVVRPPETWQTFDITFHAPRTDAVSGKKLSGRLTVSHDGNVIIDNAEVAENFNVGAQNTDFGKPGPIVLQGHVSPVRFRKLRIKELSGASETHIANTGQIVSSLSANVSDLDRIATGKWKVLVDAKTPITDPARVSFQNGILELSNKNLTFPDVTGRDVILRAEVRKISGQNTGLQLRFITSPNREGYSAWYNGADFESGDHFGFGRYIKSTSDPPEGRLFNIAGGSIGRKIASKEFVKMAFSSIGSTLTLYVDGTRVFSSQDSNLRHGCVTLYANNGVSQFKNVEYQILDPVPASAATVKPSMPELKPLAELNTPTAGSFAWVSADGLRIYWEQTGKTDDESEIWQAERPTASEPFRDKRRIGSGRQPTLTPDELQMVYVHTDGAKFKHLYSTTREAVSKPFGPESELTQFADTSSFNNPFISADGLSLFVSSKANAEKNSAEHFVSRRSDINAAWSKLERVDIHWDDVAQQAPLTWLAMAPDELSFLATHELDLGRFQVVRFFRNAKTDPFEKFEYLSLPGVGPVFGRAPRYNSATKELFLTAPADYSKSTTLAGWQESPRILWVIRNAELSSSALPEVAEADQPATKTIPADARTLGNHSYKFFGERLTWKEANAKCVAMGGNLVVIDDAEENQFVASQIAAHSWQDSWIGITDEANEGKWMTVDGKIIKYTNWYTNQPNNKDDGEHFAIISNRTFGNDPVAWRWCDQAAIPQEPHQAGFVCEWNSLPGGEFITKEAGSRKTAKWITVFNGKDLSGWTPMLTTGKDHEIQTPTTLGWSVRRNEIICETDVEGWLRLDDTYGDCEMEFQFLMPPKSNSGLLVRCSEQGKLFGDNKCEVQLESDWSNSKPEEVCGGIFGIVPPARNAFKPNVWNEMTVRVHDGQIAVRLNNHTVVDAKMDDYPALHRLPSTGHFGLFNFMGRAKGCKFRSIRVKDLTKSLAAVSPTIAPEISPKSDSPMPDTGSETLPIPTTASNEPPASDWVDLLEWAEGVDWKPRGYDWNDSLDGSPKKTGITLKNTPWNRFPLPAIIDGDYDMDVEFTRHEGTDAIVVFFPIGTHNMQLELCSQQGGVGGVSWIAGKGAQQDNSTTRRPSPISSHELHRIAIRVRQSNQQASFEIDLDDKKNYITWSGEHTRLNAQDSGEWKLTTIRSPWIGSFENRVTFEKVRVRMVSGTIQKDFITQADRDADLANGFVRLVGEPAIKPVVGFSRFCVNQIPMEVANGPGGTWPLINREFSICQDFYGAHAPSRLKCPIPRGARSFTVVGYNDGSRSTRYVIHVDGKEIYTSGITGIVPIRIDLPRDATLLELLIETGGNQAFDYSYWCNPHFHSVPVDKVTDRMLNDKSPALKFKIDTHTVGDDKLTHNQPFTFCRSVPLEYQVVEPCDEFLYSVPNASVTYAVPDGMTRFTAIGYCVVSHSVRFEVWADAKQVYASPQVGIIPIDVKLPPDTKTVELKINDLGNSEYDNAMWCFPRLFRK